MCCSPWGHRVGKWQCISIACHIPTKKESFIPGIFSPFFLDITLHHYLGSRLKRVINPSNGFGDYHLFCVYYLKIEEIYRNTKVLTSLPFLKNNKHLKPRGQAFVIRYIAGWVLAFYLSIVSLLQSSLEGLRAINSLRF